MNASFKILKERYCIREKKVIKHKEFNLLLEKDCEIGIKTIIPHANFIVLNNDSKEEIKNIIEKILFSELKYIKK